MTLNKKDVEAKLFSELKGLVWNKVDDDVRDQVRRQNRDLVWAGVRNQVKQQILDQLTAHVRWNFQ
jgi:hypothetical protein